MSTTILLLLMFFCLHVSSEGQQCSHPLNDDLVNNTTTNLSYLNTNGLIMLLPDLQFNCTAGYIQSIEIVAFIEAGSYSRYVEAQIWRPTSQTLYTLVASTTINDNSGSQTLSDNLRRYFKTYTSEQQTERLFFQKDDIIAMYIPKISTSFSQGPVFPAFLNTIDSTKGSRLYWAETDTSPCTVSLCSSAFSIQRNVVLQTKIEVNSSDSFLQPTPTPICRDRAQLFHCPSTSIQSATTSTVVTTAEPTITTSSSVAFTLNVTNLPTDGGILGLSFPLLIGIPVGGTILLITLVALLVISLICLKYRKKLWKGKTEEIHQLAHYTADDGSEYTHVTLSRKSSRASALGESNLSGNSMRREGLDCTTIDAGEEFDIATPLPVVNGTTCFTIGSPTKPIEPYASLDCIDIDNSIEYPLDRGRSATISGPIRHHRQQHHLNVPPQLTAKRSAPHFSVDNLDVVSENRQQEEALPYIVAVGSMGNIQPPPLPPRTEDTRKLSLPMRNPRISSATTRKPPPVSQKFRVSSAKTRRSSHEFQNKHIPHKRLQESRKISEPSKFPHHTSQQIPYEKPVSTQLSKQQRHMNIERSISLDTSGRPFPNTSHVSSIDATMRPLPSLPSNSGIEASPYMEPSPTNVKKFPKHPTHFLEKSYSHDIIATPYTYPSPTKHRKFSENASPYLEPSPTAPKRNINKHTTPNETGAHNTASLSRDRSPLENRLSLPPSPPAEVTDTTTSNDNKPNHPNFIYIPPEEVSRSREPHTGQVLSSKRSRDTPHVMSPPSIDERLCVPDSTARKLLMAQPELEIYSKLERSAVTRQDNNQQPFWSPPSSATELYDTLSHYQYREINRNQIGISKCLGSGHYGNVHEGLWQFKGGQLPVAVKTLKPDAPEEEEVKFIQEAAITGQFNHANIIQLHGIVSLGTPLMIILELLPKGDLKAYLKQQRKSIRNECANLDVLTQSFVSFSRDIASGMDFLSKKSFVHRDLAARNIFLTNSLTCKIGDFGMARDLAEVDYYESSGTKIPLKWTAPEAVDYRKYSTASDVWSYGMVLYEIWSLGHKPFQAYTNPEILDLIRNGYCNPPPPGCPRAVYQLMVSCWNPFSGGRPSFTDILTHLTQPDLAFLQWDDIEEKRLLGKSLEEGESLYQDLQNSYRNGTDSSLATTL